VLSPADLRIEQREERWAVWLPGERIAWFPAGARGRERLAIERRVLRLLAERCIFAAPRILFESATGFDVRAMVPGGCDPWPLYERLKTDTALARQIGRAIGAILVEQHTHVTEADVAGWMPERVAWPEPTASIKARLPEVIDDTALIAVIGRMLDAYEALVIDPADRVLVHGDLGLHNLAIEPATDAVRGIFDYDGAAWADRHHDARYLVLAIPGEPVLDSALAVYEPAAGRTLDRNRIWLYNAACAASFLASRVGVPAEQKWCGRTLAEDVRWVRHALEHVQA
jgi:aminoglycoside phosphotransferase (APT) family kinase protein